MLSRAVLALFVLSVAVAAPGQVPYPTSPDWESLDTPVSTGAALVDLNHDGWLDLVVGNGNDIHAQHLAVYYNTGLGSFPSTPTWQSSDFEYNGHLDIADVNGDGWMDVAVATLGTWGSTAPVARVYLNNAGTLSSTPDWEADLIDNAFGCAFGDMNNDGWPDLAVATGWAYGTPNETQNLVYMNTGGALEASASWGSSDTFDYQGMVWVDMDQDGWLDLACAAANTRCRTYRNLGGMLETTASWFPADTSFQDAIMVTAGDVNSDGAPELFVADNSQLGGTGRFRRYNGQPDASFATSASWTYNEGYCSVVALADVDADGDLDLATGGWWDPTRIFLNQDGVFSTSPSWSSSPQPVNEMVVFGDVDRDGLYAVTDSFTPNPDQRLFWLSRQQIQTLNSISVDGEVLQSGEFHFNRKLGWITIGVDGESAVVVEYTASSKLDMAVTDWDDGGNLLYYNTLVIMGDANCDGQVDFDDLNPFVLMLTGGYEQQYPGCAGRTQCDFDQSGQVDFDDIAPFVAALGG